MAEKILEVTERILQESSSAQPVLLKSASMEVSQHFGLLIVGAVTLVVCMASVMCGTVTCI